jgi:predicted ATP-binding protein involved in virulence
MYIESLQIQNIRAIENFEMNFQNSPGWHVLIGDNGSGKSTIIRSIALALIGPEQALGLRADWADWIKKGSTQGKIELKISSTAPYDKITGSGRARKSLISNTISFKNENGFIRFSGEKTKPDPTRRNWGHGEGWFSVAYGPYRRFEGGNPDWTKVFYSQPKLGAHLSAFGEDVALTEAIDWLIKLNYQILEQRESEGLLENLKKFINSKDFLPNNTALENISSEGVTFKDGNGSLISVNQMSDGYRSILSLTFELLRQLIRTYGSVKVFKNIKKDIMSIDLPGVVLIDEIDVHLHPTWQTRIGKWLTQYFPNIQFIVSTHSPLVCRAAENGSIWRLSSQGSKGNGFEIKDDEKDKLVFGNILDAYGTELFGKSPVRSPESELKLLELEDLSFKSSLGKANSKEEKQRIYLQSILSSDDSLRR